MENLVDEKIGAEKEEKKAEAVNKHNKQKKSKSLKNRLIALFCSVSLLASAGVYTTYKLNKVDELLSLTGVEADDEAIETLKSKYSGISGAWVDLYLTILSHSDVNCVAGKYISEDGNPINNTLNGSDIKITTSDGQTIFVESFSGNDLIYSDEEETIPTISRKDLRENYELNFNIADVKLVDETEDGERIYEPIYGPVLTKKNNK